MKKNINESLVNSIKILYAPIIVIISSKIFPYEIP